MKASRVLVLLWLGACAESSRGGSNDDDSEDRDSGPHGPADRGGLEGESEDEPDPDAGPDAAADAGCVPVEEVCNGLDDDCDIAVDEGFGVGHDCDGDDLDGCLEGIVTCAGCTDTTDDSPEIFCNLVDDDCDGETDEVTSCTACCDSFADPDDCPDDDGFCTPFGVSCADAGGAVEELCGNEVDDDCDGEVDEVAADEACNGADDDCDGEVDEGCSCSPVELICNGVDDDCDGLADEESRCTDCCDAIDDDDQCADDDALCTPFGITCADDGVDHVEVCGDGVDDDCDGTADEDCPPPIE